MHRRNTGERRLCAAAATGAVVAAAMPVLSADAVPSDGRSHEVFTQSNLMIFTGYPPDTDVMVEVVRRGSVIGFATKSTDGSGTIEMNHDGAEGDDCFESPTSPDVRAGDRIRTTILPDGASDTSVVRGVWINRVRFGVPNARSITVTGRVTLGTGPAAVNRAADVLELRINKDTAWDGTGRVDNREDINGSVNRDGTWRHVMNGSAADVREAARSSEIVPRVVGHHRGVPARADRLRLRRPRAARGLPAAAEGPDGTAVGRGRRHRQGR